MIEIKTGRRRKLISNIATFVEQQKISNHQKLRIKTEPTVDSLTPYCNLITSREIQKISRLKGLPKINDDYHTRKIIYIQTFMMKKFRIIKLELSKTQKFCYIILYDTKADQHYKIRILAETGDYILNKMKMMSQKLGDHIFKDENKQIYMEIQFNNFQRKFVFKPFLQTPLSPRQTEQDKFLQNQISKLERTQFLYGVNP